MTDAFQRLAVRRNQLAALLGVSERTLIRWDQDGRGPPGRVNVGRTVLYDRRVAEAWWRQKVDEATRRGD